MMIRTLEGLICWVFYRNEAKRCRAKINPHSDLGTCAHRTPSRRLRAPASSGESRPNSHSLTHQRFRQVRAFGAQSLIKRATGWRPSGEQATQNAQLPQPWKQTPRESAKPGTTPPRMLPSTAPRTTAGSRSSETCTPRPQRSPSVQSVGRPSCGYPPF